MSPTSRYCVNSVLLRSWLYDRQSNTRTAYPQNPIFKAWLAGNSSRVAPQLFHLEQGKTHVLQDAVKRELRHIPLPHLMDG